MFAVPALAGMNVEVQVAVPEVVPGARVHVAIVPVTPVTANVTDPVGVMAVPAVEESTTVAVQLEPWLMTTGVMQLTLVVVVRGLTVAVAAVLVLPL